MSERNPNWTWEEHILAFNLYWKIPFGSIGMRNPRVIALAHLLNRTVGSVSYKLTNFARLDPALHARGIRGHTHGAKGEEEVWSSFVDRPEDLAFESERLLADRLGRSVEDIAEIDQRDLPPPGLDREALVRVRVNQSFFRSRIMSAYENRCCITGLAIKPLLVASHIIPWADDSENRLNPRNGLCLNALHDRAFDRGLMWIDEKMKVRFQQHLREGSARLQVHEWLLSYEGQMLSLPKRFSPDPELLRSHSNKAQRCARTACKSETLPYAIN